MTGLIGTAFQNVISDAFGINLFHLWVLLVGGYLVFRPPQAIELMRTESKCRRSA